MGEEEGCPDWPFQLLLRAPPLHPLPQLLPLPPAGEGDPTLLLLEEEERDCDEQQVEQNHDHEETDSDGGGGVEGHCLQCCCRHHNQARCDGARWGKFHRQDMASWDEGWQERQREGRRRGGGSMGREPWACQREGEGQASDKES